MRPSNMSLKELLRSDCDNEYFLALMAKIDKEFYTQEDLDNSCLQYEGQMEELEGDNQDLRMEVENLEEEVADLEDKIKELEAELICASTNKQ